MSSPWNSQEGLTLELTLSPEPAAIIREKLASGRYTNASEVVEVALRLLDERDRRERLLSAIDAGLAEITRGEYTLWTQDSMRQIIEEADEEDRLAAPLNDEAAL
jgi:antitoxin ParD1/3/4